LHYRVLFARRSWTYRVSPQQPVVAVSNASAPHAAVPAPVPLRVRVHPLMRAVLFRVCHRSTPAQHPQACAPSVRFGSPSRHQLVKSTYRRDSHLRQRSALSVSRALDGLLLHAPCRFVSPCCHVRDSLFRGCLPLPSQHGSHRTVPSCCSTTFASSRVAPSVQLWTPQLQGFDPDSDSSRRAGGLDLLTTRSPLEFSTPAGVSPNTLATPSRLLRS
jgi:hypothetical protein